MSDKLNINGIKIAVISDIHDNFHNLVLTLRHIEQNSGIEQIIFLGDFVNVGVAKFLAAFKIPTTAVWGNNDGSRVQITKLSLKENSNLTVSDETFDFLKIDRRNIFITHYSDLARPIAKSGDFDACFYGHSHIPEQEYVNDCLLLNPGEISAQRLGKITYAIYDTKTNQAEMIELNTSVLTKTNEVDQFIADFQVDLK